MTRLLLIVVLLLALGQSTTARAGEPPAGLTRNDYIAALLIAGFLHNASFGSGDMRVACIANAIGVPEGAHREPSQALIEYLAARFEATHHAYIRPISACDERGPEVRETSTGRSGVLLIVSDFVDVTTPILEKELHTFLGAQHCGEYELFWHTASLAGGSTTYHVHDGVTPWAIEEMGCGIQQ